VRLGRPSGASAARTAGARAARGETLFFTDDDCVLAPDALRRVAAAARRLRRAGGPRAARLLE
jgi:glycosyltransferase involved in cell wall biosynthesis